MRLSEAIRLGAMMCPQAFGDLRVNDGTCAIGAAYDALGLARNEQGSVDGGIAVVRLTLPLLVMEDRIKCPACTQTRKGFGSLAYTITHLNDEHRWSREAIADWVETLEAEVLNEQRIGQQYAEVLL